MPEFLDNVTAGDALLLIPALEDNSIHCCISDIPYGISLDEWDVLHQNTNSALLGQSPAQHGKSGFKRRGKPIRGWSEADRAIPKEYQDWCYNWASLLYPKMKDGASVFIFGARRTLHRAIVALEDSGFLLRDILAWEKSHAHHRAQRISIVLSRRGLADEADKWSGWRLGNLAPIWEPIAWFFKPYSHTITDVVLKNEVGAMNVAAVQSDGKHPNNLIKCWFAENEQRWHEAQKPVSILEFLIKLSTREGHIVLDPFAGSGSTAVASQRLGRRFICFEINNEFVSISNNRLSSSPVDIASSKGAAPTQIAMFDEQVASDKLVSK
ncbi:MAG: site-specific DNA-methyltransferase [Chloroflexota bacterium]|nr:site-specific DNA-methyltransferase [Chloroflexota bacterium]